MQEYGSFPLQIILRCIFLVPVRLSVSFWVVYHHQYHIILTILSSLWDQIFTTMVDDDSTMFHWPRRWQHSTLLFQVIIQSTPVFLTHPIVAELFLELVQKYCNERKWSLRKQSSITSNKSLEGPEIQYTNLIFCSPLNSHIFLQLRVSVLIENTQNSK